MRFRVGVGAPFTTCQRIADFLWLASTIATDAALKGDCLLFTNSLRAMQPLCNISVHSQTLAAPAQIGECNGVLRARLQREHRIAGCAVADAVFWRSALPFADFLNWNYRRAATSSILTGIVAIGSQRMRYNKRLLGWIKPSSCRFAGRERMSND